MRTRETVEAQDSLRVPSATSKRGKHPNSRKNLLAPWSPGQSGNPGGRPKLDLSQVIARAIFENNPQVIYQAYGKLLAKGNAFGFQVVAERAFGKLKETRDTGSEYNETPDDQLQHEIERICTRLGLAGEADAAAEAGVAQARAEETNGAAKDSEILPR